MIAGGTGFLGYYTALEFLRRGHEVSSISIPDITLGPWYPKEIKSEYCDVFTTNEAILIERLQGYDAIVYAIGPDDRIIPPAPAYPFYYDRLVEACGNVISAARKAGVKRCTVLNSYFAYFDRIWPELHLADHHPYIRCRVEQAKRVIAEGGDSMIVTVLELPYIFGAMPERIPLWKDILLERLLKMNPIMFPTGGTITITVEAVGEAIVGAIEQGTHGERYPVGDQNMNWKEMLSIMMQGLNIHKKIITIPTFLATLNGKKMAKDEKNQGKESGLDMSRLFNDIQSRFLYFDGGISASILGYHRGGVKDEILKMVDRCYPKKES